MIYLDKVIPSILVHKTGRDNPESIILLVLEIQYRAIYDF